MRQRTKGKLNMLPSTAFNDRTNTPIRDAETARERFVGFRRSTASYLVNVLLAQSCSVDAGNIVSFLLGHIHSVVPFRAKKQMSGVHAGRVITTVKHAKAFRNFPIMQLPRQPMSERSLVVYAHHAVPKNGRCPGPRPTLKGLLDLRPKARLYRTRLRFNLWSALLRAVDAGQSCAPCGSLEPRAAAVASVCS